MQHQTQVTPIKLCNILCRISTRIHCLRGINKSTGGEILYVSAKFFRFSPILSLPRESMKKSGFPSATSLNVLTNGKERDCAPSVTGTSSPSLYPS